MIPAGVAKEIVKIAKSDKITLERVRKLEANSEHDTAEDIASVSSVMSRKLIKNQC
jgi:hypothetical protein